jgi:GTP-binding protein HflX
LLVLDVSEPLGLIEKKLTTCLETIERIGASGVPVITVLNKIDLLSETELKQRMTKLSEETLNPVPISALHKTNLDTLRNEILKMFSNYVQTTFTIPLTNETMSFISWLFKAANVKSLKYDESAAHVVLEASPSLAEKIRSRVEGFHGRLENVIRDGKHA